MTLFLFFLINLLIALRPWPADAYFTAGQAAAEFVWQVGYWQLSAPRLETAQEQELTFVDQVRNGNFAEGAQDWEVQGATAIEQHPPCAPEEATAARIGSLPHQEQNLITDNSIKQTFNTGQARHVLLEYCLLSWETLPLFDEPSFVIELNDTIVWQDAPIVAAENADTPYSSQKRWALLSLPQTDTQTLVIRAGNTVDPENSTVAYVTTVTTVVEKLPDAAPLKLFPASGANEVVATYGQTELLRWQQSTDLPLNPLFVSLPLPESLSQPFNQLSIAQLNSQGDDRVDTIWLALPSAENPIPTDIFLESDAEQKLVTLYFIAPVDGWGNKAASYQVWQRTATTEPEQLPIQSHSFLWQSPRLPGSQEYLTVPYQQGAEYKLVVIDQWGGRSESLWTAVTE